MKENYYVYVHLRADTNVPFYVGKGKGRRAWSIRNRNSHWKNIVNKHGLIVKIPHGGLTEEKAFEIEKAIIKRLGRKNLCNLTDGGEGRSGYTMTNEEKLHLSIVNTGRKLSPEACEKISIVHKGKKLSEEVRLKVTNSLKGKKLSAETKLKLSEAKSKPVACSNGMVFASVESAARWLRENGQPNAHRGNISRCCLGGKKSAYGYFWSHPLPLFPESKAE